MSENDIDLDQFDFEEAEGATAAKERAAETGGGVGFRRTSFISSLLDGSSDGVEAGKDRLYVRYLTDFQRDPDRPDIPVWLSADHHSYIPTKPKPSDLDKDRTWPKSMGCICRKSKAFVKRYGGACYVCDNVPENDYGKKPRPASRTWAVGVVREKIVGDGSEEMGGARMKGRQVGFKDAMIEVHKVDEEGEIIEGETEWVPHYFFAHQAYDNYFRDLAAMGQEYGTILDRDFLVIRDGEGKATEYSHVPQDPITVNIGTDDEPEEVPYDLTTPEFLDTFYPDRPDARKEMARQASDEYMEMWFYDGDSTPKTKGKGSKDKETASAPKSAGKAREADSERLASLRDRLKSRTPAKA